MSDIYELNDEDIESPIRNSEFSQDNKDILKQFKTDLLAQSISKYRVRILLHSLRRISHLIDFDLGNPSKDKLKQLASKINQDDINDEEYSIWTINETRKAIRRFYKWHTGEEDPEIVDFIRCHVKKSETNKTDPDELLSPEQAEEIMHQAENDRDFALLNFLWDSGARIGEILNLKWKDLRFQEDTLGVKIRDGKTGGRKIYLVESIEPMKKWKEYCKEKKDIDSEDYVFTNYRPYSSTDQLNYRNATKQLKRCVEESNVPEYIKTNPHAWRKARATDMARRGMNQPTMNQYFGWARGSDNPVIYIRLAQRDVEKSVRRIYNLE